MGSITREAALRERERIRESFYEPQGVPANDNHPTTNWPRVIALSGVAGSGKSTVADMLETHGYQRTKFAGPLKAMMRAIGFGDAEIEGDLKEVPHAWLQGKTPRYAMQTLGTEWGRDLIGSDFWTGLWWNVTNDVLEHGGRVVVDDCRFANEAAAVRDLGGIVVRLVGRGGLAGSHASESMALEADFVVGNVGTINQLHGAVRGAINGAPGCPKGENDG